MKKLIGKREFYATVIALALRLYCTSPARLARRAPDDLSRFQVWTGELTELLRAENLKRKISESPMAFTRRVDSTARFSVPLAPCGECLSLIHYSRVHPLESDTALMRSAAKAVKKELSAPARLRYVLRRTFLPLSRRDYR